MKAKQDAPSATQKPKRDRKRGREAMTAPPRIAPPAPTGGGLPAGRPTLLTEELIEEARTFLEDGTPLTTTAALLGIPDRTMWSWVARGRAEEKRLRDGSGKLRPKATEVIFLVLFRMIVASKARFEANTLRRINNAGRSGAWQADAWLLSRRVPERYSERRHIATEPGKPLQVNHTVTFLGAAKDVFRQPPAGALPTAGPVIDVGDPAELIAGDLDDFEALTNID